MNRKKRITLIQLLSEELVETALNLDKALGNTPYASAGREVEMFDCKEAVKRRIITLRAELLELSKQL